MAKTGPGESKAAEKAVTGLADEEAKVAGLKTTAQRLADAGWRPVEEHFAAGRAARKTTPRAAQSAWAPPPERPDPVALLQSQDTSRVPQLVPIRWGRMAVSPFTFFRGAALLMAHDLAATPSSGLRAQLCGDAHIMNFGIFASPDRTLLFDVNDFDETLPGPWEWDVKRLAASVVIAARDRGFTDAQGRDAALAAAGSYREWMIRYADMDLLKVWYARVSADDAVVLVKAAAGAKASVTVAAVDKARTHDSLKAFAKLTETVGGVPRFIDDPPVLTHIPAQWGDLERVSERALRDYRQTLLDQWRELLDRYALIDIALKVVGVGSVGTLDLIALLMGRDDGDPLILQLKEAGPSVLEAFAGRSRFRNHGRRVVAGQRMMQAASDIFLGWIHGTGVRHRDFYIRQLHDMKGSIPMDQVRPAGLSVYAGLCGWTLARAHARSGDRMAIAGYLGKGDAFDQAIAGFAMAYADQAEKDYALLQKAIKSGRVQVRTGV